MLQPHLLSQIQDFTNATFFLWLRFLFPSQSISVRPRRLAVMTVLSSAITAGVNGMLVLTWLIIILCMLIDSWPSHHFIKNPLDPGGHHDCLHDSVLIIIWWNYQDPINLQTADKTVVKEMLFLSLAGPIQTSRWFILTDYMSMWFIKVRIMAMQILRWGYTDPLSYICSCLINERWITGRFPVI